jgi:hypothetical protein
MTWSPIAAATELCRQALRIRNARVTIKIWLDNAIQDAERRGLPALRPLLEALARSTAALRSADWNCDATGEGDPPEAPHVR